MQSLLSSYDTVISCESTIDELAEVFLTNPFDAVLLVQKDGNKLDIFSRFQLISALLRGISLNVPMIDLLSDLELVLSRSFFSGSKGLIREEESTHDARRRLYIIESLFQNVEKRKEFFESCLNSIYNPIIAIDDNEVIQVYNKAAQDALLINNKDISRQKYRKIMGNKNLVEVLATGETQAAKKFWRNGKTFLSYRTPVMKADKIIGAISIFQDFSEVETLTASLERTKQLNQQLDAIIDSSFDGLYLTDKIGQTLRINKGFERISGVVASECVGRNMVDIVKDGLVSRSGSLMVLQQQKRVTVTLQTKTGKTVLVTSNPIFDESGKITMVVTNVRDVTELNELQGKLEQAEGLKEFYQTQLEQIKIQRSKHFIVHSQRMKELVNMLIKVAGVDSTILVQGESGVGKELVVDIIHANSTRREGPLVKLNCSAIPDNLLESELFGYEPGAFSGASSRGKIGLFELANKGSIFLDEIGDMPLILQAKILRTLQDMKITRLGGVKTKEIDVRIIVASNRNLLALTKKGLFREDLYYRLNVIPVYVPALRERKEDIYVLANHFLKNFSEKYKIGPRMKTFSHEAMGCLIDYAWPGNVRELENVIERLVVTVNSDTINVIDLPNIIQACRRKDSGTGIISLRSAVEETEKRILQDAFISYKSTYEIARALGVNQSTVVRKAARYGISFI